jgi:excisionase family DNA binding protein
MGVTVEQSVTWDGSEDELLTVDETAVLFKVKPTTVREWVRQGRLPCVRLGPRATRFTRPLLRQFRDANLDPGRAI